MQHLSEKLKNSIKTIEKLKIKLNSKEKNLNKNGKTLIILKEQNNKCLNEINELKHILEIKDEKIVNIK